MMGSDCSGGGGGGDERKGKKSREEIYRQKKSGRSGNSRCGDKRRRAGEAGAREEKIKKGTERQLTTVAAIRTKECPGGERTR